MEDREPIFIVRQDWFERILCDDCYTYYTEEDKTSGCLGCRIAELDRDLKEAIHYIEGFRVLLSGQTLGATTQEEFVAKSEKFTKRMRPEE